MAIENNQPLRQLLIEWNDVLGARTVDDAEVLISMLKIELAGKEEVIKALTEDIKYYRKDYNDQMIQDQGLDAQQILKNIMRSK